MAYKYITISNSNYITSLTLNNPTKLNALNIDMEYELLTALQGAKEDEKTRVIIITGAGEKSFCAGADITVFKGLSSAQGYQLMRDPGYETHRLMDVMEKPIIAAVNGYCLAGGMEIALASDFIIASEDAVFGLPEINIGIIPAWGGCVRLARKIGASRAKEWVMTGRRFTAHEAIDLGLINRVVPKQSLQTEALGFASELVAKPANALRMAKMVIDLSLEIGDKDAALAIERSAMSILISTEDCAEGVSAFLEKRKPNFTGN